MPEQGLPFRLSWNDANDVVCLEWAAGVTVDAAAAQASTEAVRGLGRGSVLLLVDARGIKVFERSARAHFLTDQADSAAMALLVGSAVNKMIANFFIGMHHQAMPVRMFTDRDAAVDWLRDQR